MTTFVKRMMICLVGVVLTAGFFLLSTSTSIYVILISIVPVVPGNSLVNIPLQRHGQRLYSRGEIRYVSGYPHGLCRDASNGDRPCDW